MSLEKTIVPALEHAARLRSSVPVRDWQLRGPATIPPVAVRPTRREFLVGAGGLLLLGAAGCASGEGSEETTEEARTFRDGRGAEVRVPYSPKRVVAVHDTNAGLQTLSLGLMLDGMVTRGGRFNPDISEFYDLEGVEPVGEVYEPNLEAIAALEPDLIVGEAFEGGATLEPGVVERLEQLAPTVFMDVFRPVEDVMADFAGLYDVRGELREQRTAYEERLRSFREGLGVDPEDVTVSFVQFQTEGNVVTFGLTVSPLQNVLTEVGFRWPEMVERAEPDAFIEVSQERLSELDGDVIFWEALGEGNERQASGSRRREVEAQPLFQKLAAVEAGQAFALPELGIWGTTFDSYGRLLDYLQGVFRDNDIDPEVYG